MSLSKPVCSQRLLFDGCIPSERIEKPKIPSALFLRKFNVSKMLRVFIIRIKGWKLRNCNLDFQDLRNSLVDFSQSTRPDKIQDLWGYTLRTIYNKASTCRSWFRPLKR